MAISIEQAQALPVPGPRRPSSLLRILRVIVLLARGLLHRILRALLVGLGIAIRHKFSTVAIVVLGIGLFAAIQANLALSRAMLGSNPSPAPAIEAYIMGYRNYDARLMWDALSDSYRRRRLGDSPDALQRQLEVQRRRGEQIAEARYVGGTALKDGRKVFLYIFAVNSGQEIQEASYTFTVDQAGKILSVD